jgi:hypothetical protein
MALPLGRADCAFSHYLMRRGGNQHRHHHCHRAEAPNRAISSTTALTVSEVASCRAVDRPVIATSRLSSAAIERRANHAAGRPPQRTSTGAPHSSHTLSSQHILQKSLLLQPRMSRCDSVPRSDRCTQLLRRFHHTAPQGAPLIVETPRALEHRRKGRAAQALQRRKPAPLDRRACQPLPVRTLDPFLHQAQKASRRRRPSPPRAALAHLQPRR